MYQWLSWCLAILVLLCLSAVGITETINQSISSLRSSLFSKPVSSDIMIIEMDAKSLQEIGQWPWKRDIHAQVINNLSAAKVNTIAFDVDFSSQSNAKSDTILAKAIQNSDSNIILATFLQKSTDSNSQIYENLPRPEFAEHALLASVNVTPNANGQIDRYDYAQVTGGKLRATLAAMLSGGSGTSDEKFIIDQAIDPETIKRISIVDIIKGRFNPQKLENKTVVIGGTAVELGDRYATPTHGIIPGVVIHVLASETLNNDMNIPNVNIFVTLGIVIILLLLFQLFTKNRYTKFYLPLFIAGLLFSVIILEFVIYATNTAYLESGLTIAFLISYLTIHTIVNLIGRLRNEHFKDAIMRLPNKKFMAKYSKQYKCKRIAVAHISNYAEINAISNDIAIKSAIHKIATRLQLMSDNDMTFVVGGNQLAWFVNNETKDLEAYFETISAFFLSPIQVENHRFQFKIHYGYDESETNGFSHILANASLAAYQSENLGYRWIFYSDDMQKIATEKLSIISDIDKAMEDGEIWIAYQPKLDIVENEITSAEALVRWQHHSIGNIAPDHFIPILEQENRIMDLTRYVLQKILIDVGIWNKIGKRINCSINISAGLLQDTDFIEEAIDLVATSNVDNDQITFEITETSSLDNMEQAIAILRTVRDAGIMVSIDDYGTGQSTLSYLRGFPANEIKIDQSFIKLMASNDVDRLMVGSTIQMAHKMNFKVVAEGVEDKVSLALLTKFGCDVAQGWHIGRPVDSGSFTKQWMIGNVNHDDLNTVLSEEN